jgi:hypothetical protein
MAMSFGGSNPSATSPRPTEQLPLLQRPSRFQPMSKWKAILNGSIDAAMAVYISALELDGVAPDRAAVPGATFGIIDDSAGAQFESGRTPLLRSAREPAPIAFGIFIRSAGSIGGAGRPKLRTASVRCPSAEGPADLRHQASMIPDLR